MLEEVNISGEWWLPYYPEKKVKGKLTFNQNDGVILELEEDLVESSEIILGLEMFNRKITLKDCNLISREIPHGHSRMFANFAFIGEHFENNNDIRFGSFFFKISHLFEWLWKNGVEIEGIFEQNMSLRYQRPNSISIPVTSNLTTKIDFTRSINQSFVNGEVQIQQYANVSFHFVKKESFKECLKLMHHFRNFLCLVTQSSTYPQKITGYLEEPPNSTNIEIYYKIDTPIDTKFNMVVQLFPYKSIENKFETYLRNWYLRSDILEPVFQLYFGSIYGRYVYLNLRFLCLVQALESYHSRTITNEEIKPDEHEKRIANILKSVPQEYKEWLEEELRYSNEPRLRKRLKDIMNSFSQIFSTKYKEPKYFLDKVVKTRNYLTHYDEGLKKESATGRELNYITEKLKTLIELCLLKEMGFSLEEINTIIPKKRLS